LKDVALTTDARGAKRHKGLRLTAKLLSGVI